MIKSCSANRESSNCITLAKNGRGILPSNTCFKKFNIVLKYNILSSDRSDSRSVIYNNDIILLIRSWSDSKEYKFNWVTFYIIPVKSNQTVTIFSFGKEKVQIIVCTKDFII